MVQETGQIDWTGAPELDVELLDVNEYSRPGTTLKQVNGIVIHYTANPGSSAMANRDYFEGLKDAHTTKARQSFYCRAGGGSCAMYTNYGNCICF